MRPFYLVLLLLTAATPQALAADRAPELGALAVTLAGRWHLAGDAVLVAEAATGRPLLCIAALPESGDSMVTEKSAGLICKSRIARWSGAERWVRIGGLAERASAGTPGQTIFLYAFSTEAGPTDDEIRGWLELSVNKETDGRYLPITVQRGMTGGTP
jgi:hypothetical protein